MTGTDKSNTVENLSGVRQQGGWIAPGCQIVAAVGVAQDAQADGGQCRVRIQRRDGARGGIGAGENRVVVQPDNDAAMAQCARPITPAGHAEILVRAIPDNIRVRADFLAQPVYRCGSRSLVEHDHAPGEAGLRQGGADCGQRIRFAVQRQDDDVGVVGIPRHQ